MVITMAEPRPTSGPLHNLDILREDLRQGRPLTTAAVVALLEFIVEHPTAQPAPPPVQPPLLPDHDHGPLGPPTPPPGPLVILPEQGVKEEDLPQVEHRETDDDQPTATTGSPPL